MCGQAAPRLLYEVDGFPIVRCRNCGLVYVGAPPRPQELLELYGEAYYEDEQARGYGGYGAAETRKRHHSRGLLDQLESFRPPGDLLEVGCAYGYFLDEARRRGWRVRGVEPAAHARQIARERLGLDVFSEPFTTLPVRPESLDALVLWDVIEHLPDPRATVERAKAWLRPAGIIALSTGNIGSLTARLQGADWSLMTPPWHQFFFSKETLARLLESAGFEVVRTRGDGNIAVDHCSARPRLRGPLARLLQRAMITRVAGRFGGGGIIFVFARKTSR